MSTSAHSFTPDFFSHNSAAIHASSPLPHGLRAEADGMFFAEFARTYSPTTGPIRLGSAECAPKGAGRFEFTATLAVGDTIRSSSVTCHGPAEAFTSMLYDAGVNLEILSFHQQITETGIVTFIRGQQDSRIAWAMGTGSNATEATAKALVAAANRTA
ncbi:hypothetical protein ASG56_14150 [Rhodococcus sp. Leaf7]|uniref:alpha-isopropylmalate synthase regulatory domain-containing protein n=1 Tax=unclassified Rhodococcus (in: high G+C Gram-positive bacteria) TaxID=192944 RepID=UPI0005AC7086|nr:MULTISPECIES: alpha-isopropylmalate synthase regulatory domain-containing protein [unclassified Rhodococcus (in: high G+C Gram-positive bacteria)]KIQ10982.1 hypothetical protein RU01_19855 [Rhodococcus sp. MEB064]KQU04480.1 hypothetical protein ASG56_14150 [Rhodococcus sp. Leaf7]KQU40665.1 hypothetical protein ASG64_14140 [Rhodococcus sp. Leaf247]